MNVETDSSASTSPVRVVGVVMLVFLIALGVWFRFRAIDQKYFWLDEVHAALLRAGYSERDLFKLFDDQPRPLADLQHYVQIDPQQPFSTTPATLAAAHPVHPPLYYCLLRAWTLVAGDSVAATRMLSAWFSLLCFPAVYWLAVELFHSRRAAWTAVALWAVSPFMVLYAQEAKQYSLFAATLMAAAAALLRAIRLRTLGAWSLYAALTAVALYTHMLFAPLLAAFAAYVFLVHVGRLRRRRTWRLFGQFAAASVVATLTLVPWAAYCLSLGDTGEQLVRGHMSQPQKFAWLVGAWISNIGCTFSDLGYPAGMPPALLHVGLWAGVLVLTAHAFRYLMKRTARNTWLFLLLLAVTPAAVLMAPDVLFGGGRSMLARYWMGTSIAILLAVAGALSRQFVAPQAVRRGFAYGTVTLLAVVGIASCVRSSQADYWWNKMGVVNNHRGGEIEYANIMRGLRLVARMPRPLIVTQAGRFQECRIVSFTYYLNDPRVEWIGTFDPERLSIPEDRTVFLFEAPETAALLEKQGWKVQSLDEINTFIVAVREPAKTAAADVPAASTVSVAP